MKIVYQYCIAILSLVVLISACEDDNTSENKLKIQGSWYVSNITLSDCNESTEDGSTNYSCSETSCTRYIFESDTNLFNQQVVENGLAINSVGTYSVSDDRLTLCLQGDDDVLDEIECNSLNIKFIGNALILTSNESETGCKNVTTLQSE